MAYGYNDTPLLPDGFHVHDGTRPQPPTIDPGGSGSAHNGNAPCDAIVLFDGTSLDQWQGRDGDAGWKIENGYMEVTPGTGDIKTKRVFGDVQLHIEFASPERGNNFPRSGRGLI